MSYEEPLDDLRLDYTQQNTWEVLWSIVRQSKIRQLTKECRATH